MNIDFGNLGPCIPKPFADDEEFGRFKEEYCDEQPFPTGSTREVYGVTGGKFVLKIARADEFRECNWIEVTAFHYFVAERNKLAEVKSWSKTGKYLIMERLERVGELVSGFSYPWWVSDPKPDNRGLGLDGNWKLCDYAFVTCNTHESEFV